MDHAQRHPDHRAPEGRPMTYPPNWPRCRCGEPVLDGHLTCGRVECDEAQARADMLGVSTVARRLKVIEALRAAARGEPTVGAIAIATRRTGVCDLGERGVCYEVYDMLDAPVRNNAVPRPGYSFIFQSGRYDGFSPDDVRLALTLTGEVCASVVGYRFTNVMRLVRDYEDGVFKAAIGPVLYGPERHRKATNGDPR